MWGINVAPADSEIGGAMTVYEFLSAVLSFIIGMGWGPVLLVAGVVLAAGLVIRLLNRS